MARTRSGKVFRAEGCEQRSPWGSTSNLLLTVLPSYLDCDSLWNGRLVCQAWRTCFSTHVKQLQLQQPASAHAARALGRKGAANFGNASIIRIELHDDSAQLQTEVFDFTDEAAEGPTLEGPSNLGCPAAGTALLRQLRNLSGFQELRLVKQLNQVCICMPALLQVVPQLRVLDLSCCKHLSSDLLAIAQALPQLEQLLLHCQSFTMLSGRRVRHGTHLAWEMFGGNTHYQPEHLAALAQLQQLKLLECPLPTGSNADYHNWAGAIAQLTQLTSLHLIQGRRPLWNPHPSALQCLSGLTNLCELRCDAGRADRYFRDVKEVGQLQAGAWGKILSGMPHLTRLELMHVCATDALLCAVGQNAPQLRQLVFDVDSWQACCSEVGANAMAHVPHIELLWYKGMDCARNLHLLQLPGIKRLAHFFVDFLQPGKNEIAVWSQDTCW